MFEDISTTEAILRSFEVLFVLAATFVARSAISVGARGLTRRAARRSASGKGKWRRRLPRLGESGLGEVRRIQRADAVAAMISRVSTLVLLVVTTAIILHLLKIDAVLLLSSAGFLGLGFAFAGQTLLRDWLTGFAVLLEDRYAVGDRVTVVIGANTFEGTVESFGGTAVRLRNPSGATWHCGHATIESVTNHSQHLIPQSVTVTSEDWAEMEEEKVAPTLQASSHEIGFADLLLLPDGIVRHENDDEVELTFFSNRQLTDRQRQQLKARLRLRAKATAEVKVVKS